MWKTLTEMIIYVSKLNTKSYVLLMFSSCHHREPRQTVSLCAILHVYSECMGFTEWFVEVWIVTKNMNKYMLNKRKCSLPVVYCRFCGSKRRIWAIWRIFRFLFTVHLITKTVENSNSSKFEKFEQLKRRGHFRPENPIAQLPGQELEKRKD